MEEFIGATIGFVMCCVFLLFCIGLGVLINNAMKNITTPRSDLQENTDDLYYDKDKHRMVKRNSNGPS